MLSLLEHCLVSLSLLLGNLTLEVAGLEHAGLAGNAAGGDEALNLWLCEFSWLDFTLEGHILDILADVGDAEHLAEGGGTLRAEAAWDDLVSKALDLGVALLDNNEVESGDFRRNDTATDSLALALTILAWAVAAHAVLKEKTDTAWGDNTLLHWEALLVIATTDAEDISFELIAKDTTIDVLTKALLIKAIKSCWVIDVNADLGTVIWVSESNAHCQKATENQPKFSNIV